MHVPACGARDTVSAAGAHKLGLQGGNELEAYVAASAVEGVAKRHGLVSGGEPNVVLRAVPDDIWLIVRRRVAPIAIVLADLAEHSDARTHRVAYGRAGHLDGERALAAVSPGHRSTKLRRLEKSLHSRFHT
jgi:hypothetical protein